MNASELLELAAVVSVEGPVLVEGPGAISASSLEQYWTASQCRFQRWADVFRGLPTDASNPGPDWPDRWPSIRATLEEVLAGEVLTRVFAAVATAHDTVRGADLAEPIARSVLVGHLEARNRVLRFLVRGAGIDADEAFALNRLRRRTERWTDMLLGYLHGLGEVGRFAVDPRRALDFAEDLNFRNRSPNARRAWSLVQTSLRAGFRNGLCPASPNADLNQRIGTSVLGCFRPELFDSTGTLRSLWITRLCNGAEDVRGMVAGLLDEPRANSTPQEEEAADRFLDRLRRFNRS